MVTVTPGRGWGAEPSFSLGPGEAPQDPVALPLWLCSTSCPAQGGVQYPWRVAAWADAPAGRGVTARHAPRMAALCTSSAHTPGLRGSRYLSARPAGPPALACLARFGPAIPPRSRPLSAPDARRDGGSARAAGSHVPHAARPRPALAAPPRGVSRGAAGRAGGGAVPGHPLGCGARVQCTVAARRGHLAPRGRSCPDAPASPLPRRGAGAEACRWVRAGGPEAGSWAPSHSARLADLGRWGGRRACCWDPGREAATASRSAVSPLPASPPGPRGARSRRGPLRTGPWGAVGPRAPPEVAATPAPPWARRPPSAPSPSAWP